MTEVTDAYTWHGRTMIGSDGQKIGAIAEIYEDRDTGKPEWATVTTGLFGTKSNFVPLAGAAPEGEDVRAQVTKDQVKDAPSVEADGELSEHEEQRLFEHYGVSYTEAGSTTAESQPQAAGADTGGEQGGLAREEQQPDRSGADRGPAAPDARDPETDEAMTRSEEELRVGTRQREAGRARLRKYVVTEMQTRTVPVQREEVRVEREPITDENRQRAMAGEEISDEEHEVVLHEEEPVVEKRTVPKERVRLDTDTVTEEHEVSEEVRKERIETEGIESRPGR